MVKFFELYHFFSTKNDYHFLYDNSGDRMDRKFFIYVASAILLGCILGNIFYKQYEKEQKLDHEFNTYLLQYGIFNSNEELKNEIQGIENYLVIEKNNKYYVYLGISSKKDNAKKIQKVLLNDNIKVTIKKSVIDNIEFVSNLEQFDILLDNADTYEAVLAVNEVILSSYEEMVLTS